MGPPSSAESASAAVNAAGASPVARPRLSGRGFPDDIIALAVRWYVRYRLSYAEVSEWLAERGILVDQSTIYRWVQRFLHVERTRNDTRRRPNSPPPPDPTPMSENLAWSTRDRSPVREVRQVPAPAEIPMT